MTLTELMEQIEDRQFDAQLNAASGLSVFRMGLDEHQAVHQLAAELRMHPEYAQDVFQRISGLLKESDAPEHLHAHDAGIAAYLYVLSRVDATLTHRAIEAILDMPQLWWARRLAKHLQEQMAHEKL